jgi:murein DD-endopeptidase MepM/ murein hydrolase activator NlpD/muramidase (phage lysozyme)
MTSLLINPLEGRSLLAPFCRVTIANLSPFTWGDGYLRSAEVALAEGKDASTCKFEIYDPGRKHVDAFLNYIELVKGLTAVDSSSVPTSTTPPTSSSTVSGTLSANMRAFLDTIAYGEGANYNTLVGGGTFPSYKDHPRIFNSALDSDAAGRYQFISTTWDGLKSQLGLADFTPANQDKAAVELIRQLGATSAIDSGDLDAAMDLLYNTWACFPPNSQAHISRDEFKTYFNQRQASYTPSAQSRSAATSSIQSTPPQVPVTSGQSLTGSQIMIEFGFNGVILAAYSFIHTSLDYSMFESDTLVFGGTAAAWVLTQRRRNTAYQNVTFKQIAQKICNSYGLKLEMSVDGPTYLYFPQRGQSDYEALFIEARRIGYRIFNKGNKLYIQPRTQSKPAFVLEHGDNLGLKFDVTHRATKESSNSEASTNSYAAGQRNFILDPDTGTQKVINPANPIGKGNNSIDKSSNGSPVQANEPKTTGETDQADRVRREGEVASDIEATFTCPTTPEFLLVDPDSAFATLGISTTLDRYWIIRQITHSLSSDNGFETSGTVYSPLKIKQANSTSNTAKSTEGIPPLNAKGFIKPTTGVLTTAFRPPERPSHEGVDIADSEGVNVWAAADGVVADVENSCVIGDVGCGGGYGCLVFIDHADGFQTRYAHLVTGSITVSIGQQVKQGQVIGKMGDTGHSRGPHLHFETRKNGEPQNPERYIKV